MHMLNTSGIPVAVDDSFRRAKAEHYLRQAGELFRMSRYTAARSVLGVVFTLDPGNKSALALQEEIELSLSQLASSTLHPNATNGHSQTAKQGNLILVVDQDERILTLLRESLRKYGLVAIGAASFKEALDVLTKFKPSLIISEVNFENGPVGFDLFFWIRNNLELQAIPFLYLATKVTREMLIAGKRMGVDEFIVKPLDEEVVMASVLNCLSRRKKAVA